MQNLKKNRVYRVAVVGGGISGLAATNRLLERAKGSQQAFDVQLFEATSRVGGTIHTVKDGDFLLEGGPDSFISEKPWAVALCKRLGLESRLIGTQESLRHSSIVHQGKLQPIPKGFYLMAPSEFMSFVRSPILSWSGKLRMAADLIIPKKNQTLKGIDESVASFVCRRLGQQTLDRLAQPLIGGIYTSDPKKLSLQATFPKFLEMEQKHRSLLIAMWKARKKESFLNDRPAGPRYGLFLSLDGGMELLVDTLRKKIPSKSIHMDWQLVSLERNNISKQWMLQFQNGEYFATDAVCLALPAYQSGNLLKNITPNLAKNLLKIEYTSTATVNLGYSVKDIPAPLSGFGFLVPEIENRPLLACSFSHLKFDSRAPKSGALLKIFLGGALQTAILDHDDKELANLVRIHLRELLGISGEPRISWVERHPNAMAQYGVGHLDLVKEIDTGLSKWPQLKLAGNAFQGVGIPDCIHRAEGCADELFEQNLIL